MIDRILDSFTWKKGCLGGCLLIVIGIVLINVVGLIAIEYSYRKGVDLENQCHNACEQNDYEKAHSLLLQLKETGEYATFKETKAYVIKSEALYLISLNEETAKKRIIYLLKEEGEDNELVSDLIDLAIENDDEAFVKSLANQYSKGANQENLKKLMEYLNGKDTNDNNKFLFGLFKKLEEDGLAFDMAIKNHEIDYIKKVTSDSLSFDNKPLLNRLAAIKDNQVSELILATLSEFKFSSWATRPPRIGKIIGDGNQGYLSYVDDVKHYNRHCLEILNIAIKAGNYYLAKRAVQTIKINYTINYRYINSNDRLYIISEDNGDTREAQKILNEAVKASVFK